MIGESFGLVFDMVVLIVAELLSPDIEDSMTLLVVILFVSCLYCQRAYNTEFC